MNSSVTMPARRSLMTALILEFCYSIFYLKKEPGMVKEMTAPDIVHKQKVARGVNGIWTELM
jgi:hypothetical protein